ncbi:MAG: porphobilinogen synthase [Sphingobacteriales bacterium]|nr:MAG: porphobilinogen synthase [Sphingobacteriales bacterium]
MSQLKNRPRRLRGSDSLRALIRETVLHKEDLIYPVFVKSGTGIREEISSMAGQFRYSVDMLEQELKDVVSLGIKSVLILGLSSHKDEHATESYDENGAVQEAIRMIKSKFPELVVMTDVCVCAYTSHGHCGIVRNDYVQNDETLHVLAQMAVSHAQAGADVVAPSAMMDGQVAAIREGLDAAGLSHVGIMGYSAKYYSACYGPFRDAADSAPQFGNRATYQMDVANAREALREIDEDIAEGADIVMVKPALFYMDIIHQARQRTHLPVAVYNTSGEFAMIKAAGEKGWIDEKRVMMEMLLSMKRAGADLIITYFAKDAAKLLN